jgi:cell division protease FtsH
MARSPTPSRPPRWLRGTVALLLMVGIASWTLFGNRSAPVPSISYTSFYALADAGQVAKVTLKGDAVSGSLKVEQTVEGHAVRDFHALLPAQEDRDLLPLLRAQKVDVTVEQTSVNPIAQVALSFLPWLLILGGWLWLSRRAAKGPGGPLGGLMGGPASHRIERQDSVRIRFDDVAGLTSAKRDLAEVVEFLRDPEHFRRLGGKLPRGVLLVGPPGTGKTLLARAVAGEAEAPFFYINGSEFIQLFVGVGASRVRQLFEEAKKVAPAIVFIDEIDAVGRARGTGLGGGNDEREQTLNQLLSELDGFTRNDLVVVLAATNRPDVLDAALLRPGRFDRHVIIDRPECKAREAILKVHTKDKPMAPDVSLADLAAHTPGFSGADLANLANEAALHATRRGADAIDARDFAAAMDKVTLGDPRETLLEPDEKLRVAVHESGHAILAHFTEHAEPLHRVSILPRGLSLGATQQSPATDRHLATLPQLEAKLRVLLGGYAAESQILGTVSTGSENDLREATNLAFKMVAQYGMSPKIGPIFFEHRAEHPFLGQRIAMDTGTSDQTSHAIEDEVRRALAVALDAAKNAIDDHHDAHKRLVDALLSHETLEKGELDAVLAQPAPPVCANARSAPS